MYLIARAETIPSDMLIERPQSPFEDADYLAMVCHEIRTPLTSILGIAHILANIDCSAEKKADCSRMLRDSSHMLMGIMNNFLDFSSLGTGKIELDTIPFYVRDVIREVKNIIAFKVQEKGLSLHVHTAEDFAGQCIGDPLRLNQILINLLGNAVKFTERGHIGLYVKEVEEKGAPHICITVTDTGIGMNEGMLKKIFNRYDQGKENIRKEYGGMGLGLFISKELTELMGGTLTVKSWPHRGSHFIVTLPLVEATA